MVAYFLVGVLNYRVAARLWSPLVIVGDDSRVAAEDDSGLLPAKAVPNDGVIGVVELAVFPEWVIFRPRNGVVKALAFFVTG